MTQHDPKDVEALIEAAKAYINVFPEIEHDALYKTLTTALAKFKPKPEKVYTMPTWDEVEKIGAKYFAFTGDTWMEGSTYNIIRDKIMGMNK